MSVTVLAPRPLAERVVEEIRVAMARQRINQVELAARMHVAQPWISRRLSGKTPITLDDIERLAEGLRLDVDELLAPGRQEGSDSRWAA